MRKVCPIFFLLLLSALAAFGQESGNRGVYGQRAGRTTPNNGVISATESKDLVPVQFIEAYVLMNSAPDEFVAVFGASQTGPTAAESNQKVNAQIEQFLTTAAASSVKRTDTYVDFITQNRVYNFIPASDGTIREKLEGFETKKTIAVRYTDRAVLEKLVAAATQASIFDLIKVDYVINDMGKIRARLFEEASRIIKQKEQSYVRALDLGFKRQAISQETYDTYYPAELYQTYTAYEAGTVEQSYDSRLRVVRERKSSTSYLEPLDRSAFDAVINATGLEPVVQNTLYLRVRYHLTPQ